MKEWFLQPEDGEEFKVFYLGNGSSVPNKPNKGIDEHGVSGCCPIGPKGEVGEKGELPAPLSGTTAYPSDVYNFSLDPTLGGVYDSPLPIYPKDEILAGQTPSLPHTPLADPHTAHKKDKFIQKLFSNLAFKKATENLKQDKLALEIDDTIESDIVSEPIAGRIYKVKGLNMLVRFMKAHLSVVGAASTPLDQFEIEYHGCRFYLNKDDRLLLKATEIEVELYLDNEL
jgi:hypothetical protein